MSSLPPNVNATEGSPFSLTCKATGRPPPTVSWLRGGTPIKELGDSLIEDLNNGTLYFMKVEKSHSGTYICFTVTKSVNGSSPHTDRRQTSLKVEPEVSSRGVAGLNSDEAKLIFALVGSVSFMIIIACLMLLITIFCLSDLTSYRGKYHVSKQISLDEEDTDGAGGFVKRSSVRGGKDNSGILMGTPSIPIFDTLRRSPEGQTDQSFAPPSSTNIALQTFHPDNNSYLYTSHASSSSLDRGTTLSPSHTISSSHKPVGSSPPHATLASTSIFSSEVEEDLTHFPRNYIQVRITPTAEQPSSPLSSPLSSITIIVNASVLTTWCCLTKSCTFTSSSGVYQFQWSSLLVPLE